MTHIRLRSIDRFIDRHGKPRTYYRKGKGRRVALPGEPGGPEFMLAYDNAARDGGSCRAEPCWIRRENGALDASRSLVLRLRNEKAAAGDRDSRK